MVESSKAEEKPTEKQLSKSHFDLESSETVGFFGVFFLSESETVVDNAI